MSDMYFITKITPKSFYWSRIVDDVASIVV